MLKSKHTTQYKTLTDINFPIFSITPSYIRIWDDMNVKYIQTPSGTYVLDNKNLEGDTLGKRRVKINGYEKYIPCKAIRTVSELIQCTERTFIDNTGDVFKYIRNKTVPLRYHTIKEVLQFDSYCVIILNKIDYKIKVNCRKAYEIQSVGLLHTDMGYILYECSESIKTNTWRKI